MRQVQLSVVDLSIAAVEQVDINNSRNVPGMIPFTTQCFFDPNEFLEQNCRIALIFELDDSI